MTSLEILSEDTSFLSIENAENDCVTYGLRFKGNALPVFPELLKSDILTHKYQGSSTILLPEKDIILPDLLCYLALSREYTS